MRIKLCFTYFANYFESGKKWMLILVLQQWDTLLVDGQHWTNVTEKLFLSVISSMLPGVSNTVLQIWAWQK